jgi:prophage regulatory protein
MEVRMLKTKAGTLVGEVGPNAERFMRRREVERRTGLARSTLYDRMAAGTFPKPIGIGGERVAWLQSEVEAWMAARIAARGSA